MFLCLTYVILTTTTSSTNYRQVTRRYCYYANIAAFSKKNLALYIYWFGKNCKKYIHFIHNNARAARSGSFKFSKYIITYIFYTINFIIKLSKRMKKSFCEFQCFMLLMDASLSYTTISNILLLVNCRAQSYLLHWQQISVKKI